jgi:uncharacterized cofD-like protein
MKKPHVVTIGGGTGQHTILRGLKELPVAISAIVSMADDGGSTGVLRDEMGVLPPGDVRNCMTALSDEALLVRSLFNYRFTDGPVKGHAFGNLFLTALEKITGSFDKAVIEASKMLSVVGNVIPVTEGDMRLMIELNDGHVFEGESHLDGNERIRSVGAARVFLKTPVLAHDRAVYAIRTADMIVLGPGDLWGSIIPPLLVDGIREAIDLSSAPVVYVANLTNKKGLTDGYTVDAYVRRINAVLGTRKITHVFANSTAPDRELVARYERQYGKGSIVRTPKGKRVVHGYTCIGADLISHDARTAGAHASYIRHDPRKLADCIMSLVTKQVAKSRRR